jgi:hypothetical protein
MKQSKIQLANLYLVKVQLMENSRWDESEATDDQTGKLALQSAKTIAKNPDYWDADDEVDEATRNHTYLVKLGIRTPPGSENGYPYSFEVIFSGIIVNFDPTDGNSDQMATKYGLALLYGAVRDQVVGMTSKMKRGQLLLPTMSFEDETYEELFAAHERLEALREKKKLAAQQPTAH